MLRANVCLFFLAIVSGSAFAQSGETERLNAARVQSQRNIFFPLSLLFPAGLREGYDLRDYIASSAFAEFDSTHTPEASLDEIYFTALEYNNGDLEHSMLTAAYGVFEHEYLPIRFFGSSIDVPLTSESRSRFLIRRSHLPKNLYHVPESDQDKPQHFFSSAWLKSTLHMDWLVKLLGHLVEEGENAFVVAGSVDPRDVHANADGARFALEAERRFDVRPSKSLTPNPEP